MTVALALVAPDTAIAGTAIVIEVAVTVTDEPAVVERVSLRVRGTEGVSSPGSRHHFVNDDRVLHEGGTLPVGTHAFVATIAIPATSPPSHDTTPAFAFLRASASVVRPFPAAELIRTHWVELHRKTRGHVVRQPALVRTRGGELEVSLATKRLAIGETVVGWIATPPRPQAIDATVQLVARTEPGPVDFGWRRVAVTLPVGELAVPFELALPAGMPPTFDSKTHDRTWHLEVRTHARLRRRGIRLELPLEIVDPSEAGPAARTAPEPGTHRIQPVFAAFAEAHGWTLVDRSSSDEPDGSLLRPIATRDLGQRTYELAFAFAASGTLAVARARYPGLGLALDVEPSTPLRELFTRDLEADHAAWDRNHHVEARFAEQTEPFLRAVVPAIASATTLGSIARWTDDEIVFTRPARGIEVDDLVRMAGELAHVIDVIAAAERTPPPDLAFDHEAWRLLATDFAGTLCLGDISITGVFEGCAVRVGVAWDGDRTRGIQATVRPPPGATSYVEVQLEHPVSAPADATHGAEFARWPTDVRELSIVGGVATASRPLASGVVGARELVELLVRALGGLVTTAPYR
ncbi:MAG: hypothetical protein ABI867_23425 [Kofleriaceae bacterium]